MKTLLLEGESDSTLDLLINLAKKLGLKSRILTDSEEEDIKLGLLMKKVETGELVDREEIMKKLGK